MGHHLMAGMCRTAMVLGATVLATPPARAELGLTPVAGFDGHLFSSYLYATTFFPDTGFDLWRELTLLQYGDPHGQVGLVVDHTDDLYLKPDLKVIVEANDFMGESELAHELSVASVHRFFPKIDWDFEKLRALDEERVLTIKFRVEVDGKPLRKLTLPVRLHPIHDCPFELSGIDTDTLQAAAPGSDGAMNIDQNWMFAAYVNERHPTIVNEILPALTEQGFVRDLTGYQAGSTDAVHAQVLSVWKLLRERGIRYSSVGTLRAGGHVGWQHVRTIERSLAAAQANCVDGSVLIASILAAIGLDPFLITTPVHCYLGFFLGAAKPDGTREFSLLETTMLGAEVDPEKLPAEALADFRRIARGPGSSDTSPHDEDPLIASYVGALLAGMRNYTNDQPHLEPPPATAAVDEAAEEEAGDEATAPPVVVPSPEWGYAMVKISELRAKGLGSIRR